MNDSNPHAHFHELLALRLYDELDADELASLEQHLQACEACRAFAAELTAGLGALRPSTRRRPWQSRARAWFRPQVAAAAALGFIVGGACVWALGSDAPAVPGSSPGPWVAGASLGETALSATALGGGDAPPAASSGRGLSRFVRRG